MKLLRLEIGDLPKEKQFRSLYAGFKVDFHSLDDKGTKAMETFSPFCFAGLNGSGKSNVLEALAAIFYHLECCVAKFKPKTFEKHFRADECNPDAFTLEYFIGQHNTKPYTLAHFDKIKISKKVGEYPTMTRQSFPFSEQEESIPVSLEPRFDTTFPQAAEGKAYLPQIIIGYSSGENEILSLPFRKSRLINFDKYREDFIKGYKYEEPENSLIYIDAEMSQAVLLACLLFEDKETLKPLRQELGIIGMRSFRINLNLHPEFDASKSILEHICEQIGILKKCASCWHEDSEFYHDSDGGGTVSKLSLDFYVDSHTKAAFKNYFSTSFDLFRLFQVLYELNALSVNDDTKEDVYKSKGFYTDWKIPNATPDGDVFFFENFFIQKEIPGELNPKELLLREFSDGEHQFLHTMGICLMLKDRKSILLLDEPETHFNPSWRAKFIKILDDSIKAGNNKEHPNGSFNVHLLKDILLTSHSPFIISDCMPDNVILFERDKDGILTAKKASELGIDTYGTSVNLLTSRIFKNKETIGKYVFSKLNEFRKRFQSDENRDDIIEDINTEFGDSIEKLLLIKEFSVKEK